MGDTDDVRERLNAEIERLEGCIKPLDEICGQVFDTLLEAGAYDNISEDDLKESDEVKLGTGSDMVLAGKNIILGLQALISQRDSLKCRFEAAKAYIEDLEEHEGAEGFSTSTAILGARYRELLNNKE